MTRQPSLLEQIAIVARRSAKDTYRQRALVGFEHIDAALQFVELLLRGGCPGSQGL